MRQIDLLCENLIVVVSCSCSFVVLGSGMNFGHSGKSGNFGGKGGDFGKGYGKGMGKGSTGKGKGFRENFEGNRYQRFNDMGKGTRFDDQG